MSPTRRALPAMLLVLGLLALILPMFMNRADSATPLPVVVPAPDFATATWSDPWDYSNPEDALLDSGPTVRLISPSISGGALNFTVSQTASFAPLWPGIVGSLYLGRDGMLSWNRVNASVYTRLRMHIYASAQILTHFDWFTCNPAASTCQGVVPIRLAAGWNDIDVPLANDNTLLPGGKPWSGMIPSLRLLMLPSTTTKISVDLMRLYQPTSASRLTWTTSAASGQLWWYDSSPFTPTASQHGGPVPGAIAQNGQSVVTDVSRYDPGNHFYAVHPDGTWEAVGSLDSMPRPVIDSPSQSGCSDYASSYIGRPWTFLRPSSMAGYANMTNLGFSASGELTATNGSPQRNDPHFWLPVTSTGIDG
ncbi:MAG TPA: hypothetical protein VKQ07_01190, partial [Jatrophihabitantaceae bacterium]|nr:hypothetical protein [Jatrophihabitantaceae bacterium]